MVCKAVYFIASALFVQAAFSQVVGRNSYVADNVVIDNDIYVNSANGPAYAFGANSVGNAYGLGIGSAGAGLSGVGLGGVGLGAVGLGSVSARNLGAGAVGLGSVSASNFGAGAVGLGSVRANSAGVGAVGLGSVSAGSVGVGSVGLGGITVAASPLVVTAISPIGPSGLAVASENVLEGTLLVTGELPFLSAVAFEGALPTAGSGVATCGCGNGNGNVGIISEGFSGRPGIYF